MDITQSAVGITGEPARLCQEELSISHAAILFSNIFKELHSFHKVSRDWVACSDGFGACMHEVLLGELHEEVSVESDIKIEVAARSFCIHNVQVECLVKEFNGAFSVSILVPFYHGFKEGKISGAAGRLANLIQKLQLRFRIFKHFLLDAAIDHSVEWSHICFIEATSLLVHSKGGGVVAQHRLLEGSLGMEV